MNNSYKEYVYDLMGVEGPHKKIISPYRFWYKHIERNALKNNGDIIEFGVYRGRSLITAALEGKLENVEYKNHEIFGLAMPIECDDVPSEILSPRNTWEDKSAYDLKANELAQAFNYNFSKYLDFANQEMLDSAPRLKVLS